ncbi:MarR family transcriptional regulator [Streptomyces sp. NPDC056230]|uniref:MarR family transcriptional regulator n=1 Tax=Streptomyces sp. NPDC056230 TaxID=3345754 RepID=UPI0035E304DB
MATRNLSPALRGPASSPAYPMANPGYGKRSAPDQQPRRSDDFALLPERERYVAGFVDHLPDGAAMNVKALAKQLPLHGQQAVGSALTALAVAGHLRRVRRPVGEGDQVRWVFRTFWSRTARDNEWWNAFLDAEDNRAGADDNRAGADAGAGVGSGAGVGTVGVGVGAGIVPGAGTGAVAEPPVGTYPPSWAPSGPSVPVSLNAADAPSRAADVDAAAESVADAAFAGAVAPGARPDAGHPSPAYLALARLGRTDHRLALSAADCAALEGRAAEWLARGVSTDYLTQALSAELPARVESPVGFLRRRLNDKIPPALPAAQEVPAAPVRRVMVECTRCGTPGRPDALPDGLCRPCRRAADGTAFGPDAATGSAIASDARDRDVRAHVSGLRDLLKAP